MEIALRPLAGGGRVRPELVVRPGAGVKSILWCNGYTGGKSIRISAAASSDYPRRRLRKSMIPKTKSPTPRGFVPKPPVDVSKEQIRGDEAANQSTDSIPSSTSGLASRVSVTEDDANEMSSALTISSKAARVKIDTPEEEARDEDETDQSSSFEISTSALGSQETSPSGGDSEVVDEEDLDEATQLSLELDKQRTRVEDLLSKMAIREESTLQAIIERSGIDADNVEYAEKEEEIDDESAVPAKLFNAYIQIKTEDNAALETTEEVVSEAAEQSSRELSKYQVDMDPEELKRILEGVAEDNSMMGNKIFVIPKVVTPDQSIDVYFNRSATVLANESEILMKGAFNGWRWKFFSEKLRKSELKGDWWSCRIHVPREAYRIDFVFFNGNDIYENNGSKDYVILVENAISEDAFEEFLVEEKQRELERLAAETAERERKALEQRKLEQERAANEADRAQAKAEVQKLKEKLNSVLQIASRSGDNLWYIVPNVYHGGDKIKLFYNRSSRSLEHSTEIWIHGGYNNWAEGLCIAERLVRSEKKDGDWWVADVVVPKGAIVLDWVFADGPPQKAKVYDNNSQKDFHAIVSVSKLEDLFWVEEEERVYKKIQQERREREEAARKKAEKTAKMKAEMKERTMKAFLLSQKHIVYTEPLEVQAGSTVNVLYNPSNTVLNGKPEVWLRYSFNRWTHKNGILPPQKMSRAGNESHLKATVKVPVDAYMMDFVFSESEQGGIFDNKNMMDYHIPVLGGSVKEPPMHIVHVAVEMAPIAKVGGLGDVVTSLSRAVQDLGHNVDIILPKYDCLNLSHVKDLHFFQSYSWGGTEIKVWLGKVEALSVYFLEPQNGMFWVGCVYGRNDDSRFGFFCHAALEFLLQTGSRPDILHCHDWSSAPVAWLYKEHYAQYGFSNSRVIFTIHNLEFGINHITRAMAYSDKATTVSDTYAKEVAGHGAIAAHRHKFFGIRNGIDPDIWDPYNDYFIPVHYTSENVVEGKRAAKEALQNKLGLKRSDKPIVGVISRLTVQKGINLIKHAIWLTLERQGQFVLLGSAPDPRIQNDFVNLANQLHSTHGDNVRLCLTYDEPLSHLIYAGADFIFVPSIFEPCGLTQLTAMRYGSIPVVRKTGGLYDTVFDVDNDQERASSQGLEPNGFNFQGADTAGVDYALNRAISAWYDAREWFNSLCKRVMEQDWSWNRPALDYLELYHSARK